MSCVVVLLAWILISVVFGPIAGAYLRYRSGGGSYDE